MTRNLPAGARLLLVFGCIAATPTAAAAQTTLIGPTPYVSRADSPFDTAAFGFCVQDFESGIHLVEAGMKVHGAWLVEPGDLTDSVDADDGAVDGSGIGGHSFRSHWDMWFSWEGWIGVEFDRYSRNGLPTEAGIVWTDGGANAGVIFQAYGPDEELLPGPKGPYHHADDSENGETAEDRFYGVSDPAGILAIELISTDGTPIEADHIQFNRCILCGDGNGDFAITASDALFTLNVAIGLGTCKPCICDATEDGEVDISDALRLLRRTVGWNSPVMRCPACEGW